MFVIAEVIHGNVYALDERGRVWRVSIGHDGGAEMSLELKEADRYEIKRLAEPRLMAWLRD